MITGNKRLIAIIAAVPFLLLISLVAKRFTTEVDWNCCDFFVIATLLLVVGISCEL